MSDQTSSRKQLLGPARRVILSLGAAAVLLVVGSIFATTRKYESGPVQQTTGIVTYCSDSRLHAGLDEVLIVRGAPENMCDVLMADPTLEATISYREARDLYQDTRPGKGGVRRPSTVTHIYALEAVTANGAVRMMDIADVIYIDRATAGIMALGGGLLLLVDGASKLWRLRRSSGRPERA